MPKKKRHQSQYSKPPSVAPPSLSLSSSSSSHQDRHHDRTVNELLADLRRSDISPENVSRNSDNLSAAIAPSVPPIIRQILQIPDTPAPLPRRPQRRNVLGRRAPPGPPPPRSWGALSQSRHAPPSFKADVVGRIQHWPLPGAYVPGEGSFVDMVMRRIALDWEQQRDWNSFYFYTLHSRLRTALLGYVSEFHAKGLSTKDIRLVLSGPSNEELADYDLEGPDLAKLNADVFYLDLVGSIGKSLTVKELGDSLFPPQQDETPDQQAQRTSLRPSRPPRSLASNLTHLSLAVDHPGLSNCAPVSWKQLLSLAGKLPAGSLTHLSLAGWPEPSLTPNAKFARVTSASTGLTVQYGGTGPYSHSLDSDWAEAIIVLKRLSRMLYGLEYLDLTGCADWIPALREQSGGGLNVDRVDWVGNWGKIATLRLNSGYALLSISDEGNHGPDDHDSNNDLYSTRKAQAVRFAEWIDQATAVEKHIRAWRSGRGRWITVEKDVLPDTTKAIVERERLRAFMS